MHLYEKIIENEKYIQTMKEIDNLHFITDGKWDWEHGMGHAVRVSNYVEEILKQLEVDKRTIELGKIAALLHDVGLLKGDKMDHAKEGSELFTRYIGDISLSKKEEELIRQAIFHHSKGEQIQSLVGAALLLADKLDVTYHRVIHSTIQDEINKEFGKIKEVTITITEQDMIVSYKTDADFKIEVLKNWEKAITIPKKVATSLGRNFMFKINEKEIDIPFVLKSFQKTN